jgi:hypothetical protein
MISCRTCSLGYCFLCAFRCHGTGLWRHHNLEIVEPRRTASMAVGRSLIHHLDEAKQHAHNVKDLVKQLRNVSELQRLKKERDAAKAFEEEMRLQGAMASGRVNATFVCVFIVL